MAYASKTKMKVKRKEILISEEIELICKTMGVDPLRIFSSGAFLVTVPNENVKEAMVELESEGIKTSVIGEVKKTKKPELEFDEKTYREPVRDALYKLWRN